MIEAVHIITGAAIAQKTQSLFLGATLAFLSHYVLDSFPQKEYSIQNIKERAWKKALPDFTKVFFDISLALLFLLLTNHYSFSILAAAFFSILPDGFSLLYFLFPKNKLLEKHKNMHDAINSLFKNKISPFWGIFCQIAVAAVAVTLLLQ